MTFYIPLDPDSTQCETPNCNKAATKYSHYQHLCTDCYLEQQEDIAERRQEQQQLRFHFPNEDI